MIRFTFLALIFISLFSLPCSLVHSEETEGQTSIDLIENAKEQWRGYKSDGWPKGWEVADGALHRIAGGDDIVTKEAFGDFELELEWKIAKGGNSGIIFRSTFGDDASYITGPEYQVFDDADKKTSVHSAGALYDLIAPSEFVTKPAGEWNTTKIRLENNQLTFWLNGKEIVSCDMKGEDFAKRLKASKFATWPKFAKNAKGHIALQDHGAEVWYKGIKITKLD